MRKLTYFDFKMASVKETRRRIDMMTFQKRIEKSLILVISVGFENCVHQGTDVPVCFHDFRFFFLAAFEDGTHQRNDFL